MPRGVKGSGPHARGAGQTQPETIAAPELAPNGFPKMTASFYGDPAKELYTKLYALLARTNGREVHIITSGLTDLADIVVMNTAADQLRDGNRILVCGHGRGLLDAIITTCNELDKAIKP